LILSDITAQKAKKGIEEGKREESAEKDDSINVDFTGGFKKTQAFCR
jgi:hypothetical protein